MMTKPNYLQEVIDTHALKENILSKQAKVGIIGLGYVGLPLAHVAHGAHFHVTGFDVDTLKIQKLNQKTSYIRHIGNDVISEIMDSGRFVPTNDFAQLSHMDVIIMCVPTPLSKYRDPDMSYVENTTRTIAKYLRPGQLVILESTTYPGTSRDLMLPILEETGLKAGRDFFIGYSPEREDPGNPKFSTIKIPKVVGGFGEESIALTDALYQTFGITTIPVSSLETAEAVKLTENIFRSVNIALVNELKVVFSAMDIDIWEVIEAAKTKPFGFMPFYPGPGLGGHCIPIDPFYLTWKAREFGLSTRFIELAGEINTSMPHYVIGKLQEVLDQRFQKSLHSSKILIVGAAYKKNVDDPRESPSFVIMESLIKRGAVVSYFDPFVPEILPMREHPTLVGMRSMTLSPQTLKTYDAAFIITDHDDVDYDMIVENTPVTVDTRHATKNIKNGALLQKIIKA